VMENDPHVCTFHIHGFNFDARATGTWQIKAWEPTGDNSTVVASGTWGPASDSGEWREPKTGAMTLIPDGHYKLFVKQITPSAPRSPRVVPRRSPLRSLPRGRRRGISIPRPPRARRRT